MLMPNSWVSLLDGKVGDGRIFGEMISKVFLRHNLTSVEQVGDAY